MRTMVRWLGIVGSFLAILNASAQTIPTGTITGTVIDAITKEPLVGANVQVLGTTKGAATDVKGNFLISTIPIGVQRLKFTYIGYAELIETDVMVMRGRPAVIEVELVPQALELQGVNVSAGYFVNDATPEPSLVTLNREEIRRSPGGFEDVVRTVAALPGVSINSAGGRNDLLVRGGGPAENLFVLNNIEVPNINHFGTQGTGSGSLSFINLDFVEDVSFSTGGFGVEYGDKLSSVLALQLGEGRSDRMGGKLLISSTQYGFGVEGPLTSKGNFIFSTRKSYLDLIFKAAGLPFIPVYTDLNLLVNVRPSPKDRIFILGLGAIDEVSRDLSSEENRLYNASILDNTQYQWIGGIDIRHALSKGYLNITLNANRFLYRFSQADEKQQVYFRSRATESEYALKVQHFWAFSDQLYLKSGLQQKVIANDSETEFAEWIIDRNGRRIQRHKLGLPSRLDDSIAKNKSAMFTELEWLGVPGLDVKIGLRADYYGFLKRNWWLSPRVSFRSSLGSRWYLKSSSGLYYQAPSLVWLVNERNRDLNALQNTMSIIGLEYYPRDEVRISLEAYNKQYRSLPTGTLPGVNDYIVMTATGSGFGGREDDFQSFGYFDLVSSGTGRAYGFEILMQKKLSEVPFFGQVGIAYSKGTVVPKNGVTYPTPFDQRWIININGGYLLGQKWQFSGRFRYFTGVPYTPVYRPDENPKNPGFIQNLPDEYLQARLSAGHHLDLRVDRIFAFKNWTLLLYLDIQNIYNFKIPVKPFYDFVDEEIVNTNSIGILPSIGVSANF